MKVVVGPPAAQMAWNVLDSDRLDGWFARRPWLSSESPFVAWVPRHEEMHYCVLEGARRLLALQDGGVSWTRLGAVSAESDLRDVLSQWGAIAPRSDREFAEAIGTSLLGTPRVFVVSLASPTMLAMWRERVARLTEVLQKVRQVPLCVVFFLASDEETDLDDNRLDIAWPQGVRRLPSESDRWAAYLHERIAWHVCGRLDAAAEVFDRAATIARGDDGALERVLNEHAKRRFVALPRAISESLLASLDALHGYP